MSCLFSHQARNTASASPAQAAADSGGRRSGIVMMRNVTVCIITAASPASSTSAMLGETARTRRLTNEGLPTSAWSRPPDGAETSAV